MKKFEKGKVKQNLKDFWEKHGDTCVGIAGGLIVGGTYLYGCTKMYKYGFENGLQTGSYVGAAVTYDVLKDKFPNENVVTALGLLSTVPLEETEEYVKRCFTK